MMIFLRLGLMLGLFAAVAHVFRALRLRFDNTSSLPAPSRLRYRIDRHKGKITLLLLGFEAPARLHFRLRRETAWDRLAKQIGLARELESGDEHFDRALYVVGDDPALVQFLSLDAKFRNAAVELFERPQVREFECRDGYAWARLKPPSSASDDDTLAAGEAVEPLEALMTTLAASLGALRTEDWTDARDPAVLHHKWINGVTMAIGVVGLLFCFLGFFRESSIPRLLDWNHVERAAVLVALASGASVLAAAWFLLRQTSRMHLVLVEVLVTLLPGGWFCGRALLEYHNMAADASAPRVAYHEVIAKDMQRSRRSTRYYLMLDRPPHEVAGTRLRVSGGLYDDFAVGQCVRVLTRRGALGDPWLERITGAQREACQAR